MTKDHILSEIRRIATQNGGKPLGRGRFFTETGIKESDWHGKYWVRWSDAVKEAGFQPNRLTAAISEDVLLSRLAAFVKELGHFPVAGEIKMKARSDTEFPCMETFQRLGGKSVLLAKLRSYCLNHGEKEIAALCTQGKPIGDEPESESIIETVYGFVYLMKSGKYYKIGRSNAVGRRERELAIQLPEKANVVHSIRTDDPAGIEGYWHKRFDGKRKNGEWFELTASDVAAFRRRKFM